MLKTQLICLLILFNTSIFAQRLPGHTRPAPPDRNDPAYLENIYPKQQKAGKILIITGSALAAGGGILEIIGHQRANAPNHEAWAGFGEQVIGIGLIAAGVTAAGVGTGLFYRGKANKKRLMKLQPSVTATPLLYSIRSAYCTNIGIKLTF